MKVASKDHSLEVEQLIHTIEIDPGYAMVRERIERAIAQATRLLVTAQPGAVAGLQSRVTTLEMVLALPRQILLEMKAPS